MKTLYAGKDEAVVVDVTSWSATTGEWAAPSVAPTIRAFLSATAEGSTALDASVDVTLTATSKAGRFGGIIAGSAISALVAANVRLAWRVVTINGTQWGEAERVKLAPRPQR